VVAALVCLASEVVCGSGTSSGGQMAVYDYNGRRVSAE
jgi:hypothetical protein